MSMNRARYASPGNKPPISLYNLHIAQSVAVGHNLPTQFPPDVSQAPQFLFFFQAGNLEFLGLNLAWSVDVLSVFVIMSMLAIVMALGELLFNSRVVGRLGATLFFFMAPCGV